MSVLTVATVSMFNCLIAEELQTNIWKATVTRDPSGRLPFELLASPAAGLALAREITMPEGRIGTLEVSSPLAAKLITGTSTGAYTTIDPLSSVIVS